MLNRLTKWSEKENKISNNQFGFQRGKSTADCIFILSSIISKTLHQGEKLYCVFLDYEKAFDNIDRNLLWQKLISEHVSTKLVIAIRSMYNTVKSCIRYQASRSSFFESHVGLKQGDPSSPFMFMLFINDITESIISNFEDIFTVDELKIFMLLYADDAVIFAKSPEVLQSVLNDIETYCVTWGLKINTFYRPPNSSVMYHSTIEDSIHLALDTGIPDVVITGDFNYNLLSDQTNRKISSICQQFSLHQCISEPTHYSENASSLLDIILVIKTASF